MLTAHQRLAIRIRLPEVCQVFMPDEAAHNLRQRIIRMNLTDGSQIVIYGQGLDTVSRHRLRLDDSGLVTLLPIDSEMRARLEAVFGPLRYREGSRPC